MDDEERQFRRLVDEAVAVVLRGWDFSALSSRTASEPLPWDYLRLARESAAHADRVLDVDTGGGEVLAAVAPPAGSIAVEPYPPNVEVARTGLAPYGVEVRARHDQRLPVEDGAVDLVLNRHGALDLPETVRVLRPGGRLVTQQVGRHNDAELNEAFGVATQDDAALAGVDAAVAAATAVGLVVERCDEAWPRTDYLDVGALVLQLLAVPWQVPGFDAAEHLEPLRRLHRRIREHGRFSVTSHRLLLVARRP